VTSHEHGENFPPKTERPNPLLRMKRSQRAPISIKVFETSKRLLGPPRTTIEFLRGHQKGSMVRHNREQETKAPTVTSKDGLKGDNMEYFKVASKIV